MKIYDYSRDTGELLGERIAREDPLEPGRFVVPAYATTIAPPATRKKGTTLVFKDGVWTAVVDYRSNIYYDKKSKQPVRLQLGESPTNSLTTSQPSNSDDVWSREGWKPKTKTYDELRKAEYPPLADLADAMYWASKGDSTKLTTYYAKIEAVKQKYPKG